MTPILSILTCTIPERQGVFVKLLKVIQRQWNDLNNFHPTLGDIEVILDDSESFLNGGLSIGKKREGLVNRAKGKYLCFLDDDEEIAPNYVETLVRLCQEDKDACTFKAIAKTDSFWGVIDMSIHYPDEEARPGSIINRNLWHVCPIRTGIAQRYSFPDTNYGEDITWLKQVRKDIKDEAHSEFILLQYNHSSTTSEADRITKYQHGNI